VLGPFLPFAAHVTIDVLVEAMSLPRDVTQQFFLDEILVEAKAILGHLGRADLVSQLPQHFGVRFASKGSHPYLALADYAAYVIYNRLNFDYKLGKYPREFWEHYYTALRPREVTL